MMTIQERVYDIVAQQMGVEHEELLPETSLSEDLGADSLDITEIVMELEVEFEVEMPESVETDDFDKLGDITDMIDELLSI